MYKHVKIRHGGGRAAARIFGAMRLGVVRRKVEGGREMGRRKKKGARSSFFLVFLAMLPSTHPVGLKYFPVSGMVLVVYV